MWAALRNRQLGGFKFRRQVTIGPFVVDFLCIDAGLIIELDGGQHSEDRDTARTVFLADKGFAMLRFWNHEVIENFDGVIRAIIDALDESSAKKTLTQPSPAKAGEG